VVVPPVILDLLQHSSQENQLRVRQAPTRNRFGGCGQPSLPVGDREYRYQRHRKDCEHPQVLSRPDRRPSADAWAAGRAITCRTGWPVRFAAGWLPGAAGMTRGAGTGSSYPVADLGAVRSTGHRGLPWRGAKHQGAFSGTDAHRWFRHDAPVATATSGLLGSRNRHCSAITNVSGGYASTDGRRMCTPSIVRATKPRSGGRPRSGPDARCGVDRAQRAERWRMPPPAAYRGHLIRGYCRHAVPPGRAVSSVQRRDSHRRRERHLLVGASSVRHGGNSDTCL